MTLFIEKPDLVRPTKTSLESFGSWTMTPLWRMAHRSLASSHMIPADQVSERVCTWTNLPFNRKRKSRSFEPSLKSTCCSLASS